MRSITTTGVPLTKAGHARRAGVAALAVLALAAGSTGVAPSDAQAMDDEYGSGSEHYESPITCMAATPYCGYHVRHDYR